MTNAAYGSDPGSFFANDMVSLPEVAAVLLKVLMGRD